MKDAAGRQRENADPPPRELARLLVRQRDQRGLRGVVADGAAALAAVDAGDVEDDAGLARRAGKAAPCRAALQVRKSRPARADRGPEIPFIDRPPIRV